MKRVVVASALLLSAFAQAQNRPIRIATVAPAGTGWAHELTAFADRVAAATNGGVKLKWYFGGVTGDELETLERMRKGELDGAGSGQMLCERIVPAMRVMRLLGVFQSRGEAAYAYTRLFPQFEAEAAHAGYKLLVVSGMGPDVIFSRTPVRNMADLRRLRFWRWDIDEVGILMSREMGLQIVPTPLYQSTRAYDDAKLDGFLAIPSAALAFQWSARAHYLTDLRTGYLTGCLVLSRNVYDRLTAEQQRALLGESAQLAVRWEALNQRADDSLLGGIFKGQGLTLVPVSDSFRTEFFDASTAAREKLGEKLVPKALLDQVLRMLADYRAEHGRRP